MEGGNKFEFLGGGGGGVWGGEFGRDSRVRKGVSRSPPSLRRSRDPVKGGIADFGSTGRDFSLGERGGAHEGVGEGHAF